MAGISFYGKKGTLRIYATNSTGGEAYLEMRFENSDLRFPFGPPQPLGTLVLDRETQTADAHYIEPSDRDVLAPMPLSFSLRAIDKYVKDVVNSFSNPFGDATWTIGNKTWTGISSTAFTRKDTNNSAISIPAFVPTSVKNYLVRCELKLDKGSTEAAVTDWTLQFTGVHFPRDQIQGQMAIDGVTVTANGLIYGDVLESTSNDFSAGVQTDT